MQLDIPQVPEAASVEYFLGIDSHLEPILFVSVKQKSLKTTALNKILHANYQ